MAGKEIVEDPLSASPVGALPFTPDEGEKLKTTMAKDLPSVLSLAEETGGAIDLQ